MHLKFLETYLLLYYVKKINNDKTQYSVGAAYFDINDPLNYFGDQMNQFMNTQKIIIMKK